MPGWHASVGCLSLVATFWVLSLTFLTSRVTVGHQASGVRCSVLPLYLTHVVRTLQCTLRRGGTVSWGCRETMVLGDFPSSAHGHLMGAPSSILVGMRTERPDSRNLMKYQPRGAWGVGLAPVLSHVLCGGVCGGSSPPCGRGRGVDPLPPFHRLPSLQPVGSPSPNRAK